MMKDIPESIVTICYQYVTSYVTTCSDTVTSVTTILRNCQKYTKMIYFRFLTGNYGNMSELLDSYRLQSGYRWNPSGYMVSMTSASHAGINGNNNNPNNSDGWRANLTTDFPDEAQKSEPSASSINIITRTTFITVDVDEAQRMNPGNLPDEAAKTNLRSEQIIDEIMR